MNILIISFDADPPYKGGVATVTNVLAKAFMARGHFCALGYMDNSEHPSVFFKYKVKLAKDNQKSLEEFFKKYHFDIILCQLPTLTDFSLLLSLTFNKCKIISVYHSRPMLHPLESHGLLKIYTESDNLIYKIYTLLKIPLLPLYHFFGNRIELKKYKEITNESDKILLLSNKFFPNWMNLVPETEDDKLTAIGNPLVFNEFFAIENINEKEHLVIVVANLNHVKRADLLVHIWSELEKHACLQNWNFEFIGDGYELDSLKKTAKKLNLKRIKFIGSDIPINYYKRAQIMMLTSKYEGWPMVIMEGQQMGVIPVSFNSFESITDIINHQENGLIIPNNDITSFVENMKNLMLNDNLRNEMIFNAIKTSNRFNKEIVADQYINLFNDLLNNRK